MDGHVFFFEHSVEHEILKKTANSRRAVNVVDFEKKRFKKRRQLRQIIANKILKLQKNLTFTVKCSSIFFSSQMDDHRLLLAHFVEQEI